MLQHSQAFLIGIIFMGINVSKYVELHLEIHIQVTKSQLHMHLHQIHYIPLLPE